MIFGRGRPSLKVSGEGMVSEMMAGVSEGVWDFFLLKTMMMARQSSVSEGICSRRIISIFLRNMSQVPAAGSLRYDVGLLAPLPVFFWPVLPQIKRVLALFTPHPTPHFHSTLSLCSTRRETLSILVVTS